MAMISMNNLLNGKDSRWLQLEVCREFQRNRCTRQDTECKFAHPPANVEVQNGKVTACYDSIKDRCNRGKPPCKYFHPPQHLKEQLLINGRNHLALKNSIMQQMGITPGGHFIPGQVQALQANTPYITSIQANTTFSPYYTATGQLVHTPTTIYRTEPCNTSPHIAPVLSHQTHVPVPAPQKLQRTESYCGMVPYKNSSTHPQNNLVYLYLSPVLQPINS